MYYAIPQNLIKLSKPFPHKTEKKCGFLIGSNGTQQCVLLNKLRGDKF